MKATSRRSVRPPSPAGEVRFAVITDVHLGRDNRVPCGGTLGTCVPRILRRFHKEMRRRFKPDFVISLGDMLSNENTRTDAGLISRFRSLMESGGIPVRYVLGNHEVKTLSDRQLRDLLGLRRFNYCFDVGDYRFLVLHSYSRYRGGIDSPRKPAVTIPKPQLRWLRAELAASPKPVLVFSHHPLDEQSLRANVYAFYFLNHPERALVGNRREVRRLLASAKVLAAFAGHLHWHRRRSHSRVSYITVPSLSEIVAGRAGGQWLEVTLRGRRVGITVRSAPTGRASPFTGFHKPH